MSSATQLIIIFYCSNWLIKLQETSLKRTLMGESARKEQAWGFPLAADLHSRSRSNQRNGRKPLHMDSVLHSLSYLGREWAAAGGAVGSFHKRQKGEEKYVSKARPRDSNKSTDRLISLSTLFLHDHSDGSQLQNVISQKSLLLHIL